MSARSQAPCQLVAICLLKRNDTIGAMEAFDFIMTLFAPRV
jgi:hypothetical protein